MNIKNPTSVWELLDNIDTIFDADTSLSDKLQHLNRFLIEALDVEAVWCVTYHPLPATACGLAITPLSMAPNAEICILDQAPPAANRNDYYLANTLLNQAVAAQTPLFFPEQNTTLIDADLGDILFSTGNALPVAVIPLLASQTTWGALVVGQNKDTEEAGLPKETRRLLLHLAKRLARNLHQLSLLEKARRHANAFVTLNQIAQTITSSLDIDDVIQRTMAGINTILDVEAGSLLLLDECTNELYFKITLRGENKQLTSFRLKPHEGIAGWVVTHNQPTVVNNPAADSRFSNKIDKAIGFNTASVLAAPLMVHGAPLGALEVLNKKSGFFTKDDQNLLVSMAASLGIALQNAILYDKAQDRARKNEIINQITAKINAGHGMVDTARLIYSQFNRLFAFNHISFAQFDWSSRQFFQWIFPPEGLYFDAGQLTPLPLEPSKLAQIIRAGHNSYLETNLSPVPWPDDQFLHNCGVRSRMTVLLATENAPYGALTVGSFQPDAFSRDDLTLLERLSLHLAIVIEKAMLLDDMSRRTSELHTLNRLSEMLGATVDLPGIVETTVNMLPKILQCEAQGVAIVSEDGLHVGLVTPENFNQTDQLQLNMLAALNEISVNGDLPVASSKIVAGNPPVITPWQPLTTLSLPILTHHGAEGVIYAATHHARPFSDNFLRVFSLLVSQISAAVENAHLFQQVEQERARLATILASSTDAILVVTRGGQIVLDNPAAWQILGVTETQRGRLLTQVTSLSSLINLFKNAVSTGKTTGEIKLDDGRTFFANLSPVAVGKKSGAIGWVASMQDVSHFKELDQLKDEFVNAVSHDLRSPLSSILIATRLIEQAGEINTEQRDMLNVVERRVRGMSQLIDDLLDAGRIEAGIDMELTPCDISEIASELTLALRPQANDLGLQLRTEFDHKLPPVLANPHRLYQVINNLVGNAIKYTSPGGSITVKTYLHEKQVRFQVADTGLGIPASDQPHIFKKFYRVKAEHSVHIKGSGLGLAIVKSIVDKLNGQIWFESVYGEGSTFTVALPPA